VITVAACFGYYVAKGLPFVIMTGGIYKIYGPPNSMIGDNNDFGLAVVMTLPIYFFLAKSEEGQWGRRLAGIICLMAIPAVMFTYSRGAMVGLAVVLLLLLLTIRQRFAVLMAIGVVAAVVTLAPNSWKDRMNPTSDNVVDGSAQSRLFAWQTCWRLASDYPIAGGGFDTLTPSIYARYSDNPRDNTHGPHSVYFQILADHGFVGFFLYALLVFSCLLTSRQVVRRGRLLGDQKLIHYANMFRFGLVGFLASGTFAGRAYFDYFFLLVACFAILKRLADEALEASPNEEESEEASDIIPAGTPEWSTGAYGSEVLPI